MKFLFLIKNLILYTNNSKGETPQNFDDYESIYILETFIVTWEMFKNLGRFGIVEHFKHYIVGS